MDLNLLLSIAADEVTFCSDSADMWQFVGQILLVFKIVIPIILIIMGMVDLGKAVVSSDEKAISKAATSLLRRVIAGVLIFFVPSIVGLIFNMVGGFQEVEDEYDICAKCISNPNGSTCDDAVDALD